MKIKVNLTSSFITFNAFRRAYVVSGKLPLHNPSFFDGPSPAHPFILDKVLYVPLSIGGKTLGLLHASVSCASAYASGLHVLPDAAAVAKAGLKISSQCENLLKPADAGCEIFNTDRGRSSKAFRCRPDDVVKALAMGLLSLDCGGAAVSYTDHNYHLVKHCDGMGRADRELLMLNAARDGTVPKEAYGTRRVPLGGGVPYMENRWSILDSSDSLCQSSLASQLAYHFPENIIRTAVQVEGSQVQKWRKPPHSSMWPWTMDHHWFLCESGPIATAHHSMMALMDPSSKSSDVGKDEEVYRRLPIVADQLTMDKMRKLMEAYFQDIESTMRAQGPRYSEFRRSNEELRWVGAGRYSMRSTSPEESPSVMCLALGVRPKLDGRSFRGFIPAENSLIQNTRRFHCSLTPTQINSSDPKVACIVMYSCGLISDVDFTNLMGPCVSDHDPAREAGHVKMEIGPLVTVLVPRDSWYSEARKCMFAAVSNGDVQPPLSEANVVLAKDSGTPDND